MLIEKYKKKFGKYEIVVYVEKTENGYQRGIKNYCKNKLIAGMFMVGKAKTLNVYDYYENSYDLIPNLRNSEMWEYFIRDWGEEIKQIKKNK